MRNVSKEEDTPQPNEVFKNTETPQNFCENALKKIEETPQKLFKIRKPQNFCGNSSKKEETPQLNRVSKYTETPNKFCGNASKILENPFQIFFS